MVASYSSSRRNRSEELIRRLGSRRTPSEAKLKALRDLKNQIIGNPTRKLDFLKLGAVPCITSILSSVVATMHGGDRPGDELNDFMAIQAAVAIGSFACGLESGVKAVLEAGAFPILMSLISHRNKKVVDAGSRSIKLIYRSKLAPKFDFLIEKNIKFLVSMLNSNNENVTSLGANVIAYSLPNSMEQQALSDAGIITKLVSLLEGSLNQREASLESISAVLNNNPEIVTKFVGTQNGKIVNAVIELIKDKHPRMRLLACRCLIIIRNTCTSYLQDAGIKAGLVLTLRELLDDPGQVGDDAPFELSSLVAEKEDLQKIAFNAKVIDKLCNQLEKGPFQTKRLQGIFLALAAMCSKLESCRDRALSLEARNFIKDAIENESADVRCAACAFLRNLSCPVKNLSAGHFMDATVTGPMVELLCGSCTSVQIAALGVISKMLVDFGAHGSIFMQCGGLKQLIQLSKSVDSAIRVNAIMGLKESGIPCKQQTQRRNSHGTNNASSNNPHLW